MSSMCTFFAGRANTTICEFVTDTEDEVLNDLPTTTHPGRNNFAHFTNCVPIGSQATTKRGDEIIGFILFSDGWTEVK